MLLKLADNKEQQLRELERLLAIAPADRKAKIEQELRFVRAGIKGEQESAYLIDFDFKNAKNTAVIHDLRLEINSRVAQIDHLLIHRTLNCFVLETKHFHAGIKITDDGEFLRWNDYKKTYEGMPSPLAQNERHMSVLADAFAQIEMPTRMGIRLSPILHSYILIAPNARIDRPRKFDSSRVIKADAFLQAFDKQFDEGGMLGTFGSLARMISPETVQEISHRLLRLHKPATFDYAAKFGINENPESEIYKAKVTPEPVVNAVALEQTSNDKPKCRSCGTDNLSIAYGKYGYYFKCLICDGNTPIKLGCGKDGHKERLRKDGRNFYRECAECGSSALYFVNPA
jgi:hypothetical protein